MDFRIETPQAGLTLSQLLINVYRATLANSIGLFRKFFLPAFLWCFGFGLAFTAAYYGYIGKTKGFQTIWYLPIISILGLVIQFLANCKLSQLSYAVSKNVLCTESSESECIHESEIKRTTILKLSSFVLFSELAISGWIVLAQFLNNMYYDPDGPTWTRMNVAIATMQFGYYFLWFPHMALYVLNAYLLASATQQELDLGDAVDHFLGSHLPSFLYFSTYVFTATLTILLFVVPILVGKLIDMVVPWSHMRELYQGALMIVLDAPIATFFFALLSVGGAYLSKQRVLQSQSKN